MVQKIVFSNVKKRSSRISLIFQEVSKHFAYGDFTEGMLDRPDLPAGHSSKQLLAIPVKPSHKSKVLWFLCRDESELQ